MVKVTWQVPPCRTGDRWEASWYAVGDFSDATEAPRFPLSLSGSKEQDMEVPVCFPLSPKACPPHLWFGHGGWVPSGPGTVL